MRKAYVHQQGVRAGTLEEIEDNHFRFMYEAGYSGEPVSLTMPVRAEPYVYDHFPPAFEGVLPEGLQLATLLKRYKLDANDYFGQLLVVGQDLVGSLTIIGET